MENVRNHRDIKLSFNGNRNEKKTRIKMNKPLYLGASILDFSKTLMFEFWYDYLKPKYRD